MQVYNPKITLLTGIPRSGTTLTCSLINKHTDFVALHEPIEPKNIIADCPEQIAEKLNHRLSLLGQDLASRREIDNGADNLLVDNPIGMDSIADLRQVSVSRGKVLVSEEKSVARLFVKQNAMFTALLGAIKRCYPIVAIVRNPIDVLCSWYSVQLPVNQGRLPAGEMIDRQLKQCLADESDVFTRQCIIFQWFITQYRDAGVKVVCYEDIIQTGGEVLFEALGVRANTHEAIVFRKPSTPSTGCIQSILENADKLQALHLQPFYTADQIEHRLNGLAHY